jgi:hypothetical protein
MQWTELHKSLQPYLLLIATALISNFFSSGNYPALAGSSEGAGAENGFCQ